MLVSKRQQTEGSLAEEKSQSLFSHKTNMPTARAIETVGSLSADVNSRGVGRSSKKAAAAVAAASRDWTFDIV